MFTPPPWPYIAKTWRGGELEAKISCAKLAARFRKVPNARFQITPQLNRRGYTSRLALVLKLKSNSKRRYTRCLSLSPHLMCPILSFFQSGLVSEGISSVSCGALKSFRWNTGEKPQRNRIHLVCSFLHRQG